MNEYDINNAAVPSGMRHVVPESFLMSTAGCRVDYILTVGNRLLDAHEREVIKAGAKFRWYGHMSADNMLGSKTTRGGLLTYFHPDTAQIIHDWAYDQ
jgi:hypothetical protein